MVNLKIQLNQLKAVASDQAVNMQAYKKIRMFVLLE